MIVECIVIFLIPMIMSFFFTPWVITLSHRIGVLDTPNERKIHQKPTPRLGGIAIFISFGLSVALIISFYPELFHTSVADLVRIEFLMFALLLVVILGAWDDVRSLSPYHKLLVQFCAATLVYAAGFHISGITHPFGGGLLLLRFFDYPATILWILGVTNAINLIDGLDGLASGVAIIASLTIAGVSFMNGNIPTAILMLILAGAVFGFLRFNFNPARIFLGDSGSLFIGFTLAVLSIESSTKSSTAITILIPILALGLPIMDTLISMIRRFFTSLPGTSSSHNSLIAKVAAMFLPDRNHIHHKLIARGFSHRKAVLILYVVSCIFGIGAFAITATNDLHATYIIGVVAILTIAGVRQLGYREIALLRNGVFLPLYERPILYRTSFQAALDSAFIVIAYTAACYLGISDSAVASPTRPLLSSAWILCSIQLGIFYTMGMYKATMRHLVVGDLLQLVKIVATAVVVGAIVLSFLPQIRSLTTMTFVIIEFYLLLTLVVAARLSYPILNYLFRRSTQSGKRILIYGADTDGVLVLQQMLNENVGYIPVGFLDESSDLEGKHLNGYPIFGGHWKIPKLAQRYKVDEIVITSSMLRSEGLERVKRYASQYGIILRRFTFGYEEVSSVQDDVTGQIPSVHRESASSSLRKPSTPLISSK